MSRRARPGDPATRPARVARDVDDEIAFHHQRTIEELLAAGLSPEAAEAEARRRFGPVETYRHRLIRLDLHDGAAAPGRTAMHVLASSLRTLVRDVRRAPGFTLGIVAVLTLGLGVNAVTFGLVDRLVVRGPAGIQAPEELRRVVAHRVTESGAAMAGLDLSYTDYRDLLALGHLAGAAAESTAPLLFGAGEGAERIDAVLVTGDYFTLLGATPAAGRFFTADDSARQRLPLVVLGHAFWQRRFGGDPSVIGRRLPIGSGRYEVVGIAAPGFTGSSVRRTDVFLPLEAAAGEQVSGPWETNRNFIWMTALVRLAPGASDRAAADEATARLRRALAEDGRSDAQDRIAFAPLNALAGDARSDEAGIAALVGAVALLVLLIAFANAANLFLARALRRRDQIAVRLALGSSRRRLLAEEAALGALIALPGVAIAVAVASIGAPVVQRLLFPQVAWLDGAVDARLLIVLAGLAIAGGAAAASVPIWQTGRADLVGWLRDGGERGPARRTRTQLSLTVAQGALSVLLLVGAGLFVRSLIAAQSVDLGLHVDRLLTLSLMPGEGAPPVDVRQDLRPRVDRIPGVEGTTLVAGTFPFVSSWSIRLAVPGLDERPGVQDGGPYVHAVEPGYFDVVGTTIEEGRAFTPEDRQGAPPVAVVNRTMARLYWPGEPAIGKCLQIGTDPAPCTRVVGVAENTRRQEIIEGDSLLYYVPLDQAPENMRLFPRLIVRAADAGAESIGRVAETVRREALALAPSQRYVAARPLEQSIAPQLRTWRLGASLLGSFGLLALVVATVGLYGVVAFDLAGRRREMGIRTALGATGASIVALVVRGGLRTSAAGVALGLAVAWLVAPLLAGWLYEVPARDGRVFGLVTVTLLSAAVVASVIPGLRAARVDPGSALRDR